jgi:hypothetical protein
MMFRGRNGPVNQVFLLFVVGHFRKYYAFFLCNCMYHEAVLAFLAGKFYDGVWQSNAYDQLTQFTSVQCLWLLL